MSKKNLKKNIASEISENNETNQKQNEYENTGFTAIINKNKIVFYILFVFIVGMSSFLMYQESLDYENVYCDDNIFVNDWQNDNKDITKFWTTLDRTFGTSYYRPTLAMSFVIDGYIGIQKFGEGGHMNPWPFHLTNLLLHSIGSVLVLLLFLQLNYNPLGSFLFALLFAMHPIITPAACWISGRNDTMLSIFALFSFVTVIQYYNSKNPILKVSIYLVHMFLFLITLFTKEIAVMFPIVVVCYNLFYRENILTRKNKSWKLNFKKFFSMENMSLAAGWTILFFVFMKFREIALSKISSNPDEIGFSAFFKNLPTVPAMVGKIFLPVKMIALSTFESFSIITGLLFLALLIAAYFYLPNIRKRHYLFGIAWFVLFLGPSLFVRIYLVDDFFDYAEHRAFLIMIGIFMLVMEILLAFKVNFNSYKTLIIFGIILALFYLKSNTYKGEFDGRKNFWSHMTEMYPYKSRGYLDLGKAYLSRKEFREADSLYNLGLIRNPNNVNFYIDLGSLELQRQNPKKAEEYLRKAYQMKPNDFLVNYHLGTSLIANQNFTEATQYLINAMRRDPSRNPDIPHKAAISLHNQGKPEEAIKYYDYAYRLNSNDPQILSNMGLCMSQLKDPNAENVLLKSIQISPKNQSLYDNYINYLVDKGEKEKINQIIGVATQNNVSISKRTSTRVSQLMAGLKPTPLNMGQPKKSVQPNMTYNIKNVQPASINDKFSFVIDVLNEGGKFNVDLLNAQRNVIGKLSNSFDLKKGSSKVELSLAKFNLQSGKYIVKVNSSDGTGLMFQINVNR